MDGDLYPNDSNALGLDIPEERKREEQEDYPKIKATENLLPEIQEIYKERIEQLDKVSELNITPAMSTQEVQARILARSLSVEYLKADLEWLEGQVMSIK